MRERASLAATGVALLIMFASGLAIDPPSNGANGKWVAATDFDGNPTGPYFQWNADAAIWSDPSINHGAWPPINNNGDWESDDVKRKRFVAAGQWGRPTIVKKYLPSTPEFPIGWISLGQTFYDPIAGDVFMICAAPELFHKGDSYTLGIPQLKPLARPGASQFGPQIDNSRVYAVNLRTGVIWIRSTEDIVNGIASSFAFTVPKGSPGD